MSAASVGLGFQTPPASSARAIALSSDLPSISFMVTALLDGFLQLLRGAEGDLLAGLDLGLARRGVAPHARRTLANLEDAKAAHADAAALLQVSCDGRIWSQSWVCHPVLQP